MLWTRVEGDEPWFATWRGSVYSMTNRGSGGGPTPFPSITCHSLRKCTHERNDNHGLLACMYQPSSVAAADSGGGPLSVMEIHSRIRSIVKLLDVR
jgi:hypothetical protein